MSRRTAVKVALLVFATLLMHAFLVRAMAHGHVAHVLLGAGNAVPPLGAASSSRYHSSSCGSSRSWSYRGRCSPSRRASSRMDSGARFQRAGAGAGAGAGADAGRGTDGGAGSGTSAGAGMRSGERSMVSMVSGGDVTAGAAGMSIEGRGT